MRLIDAEPLENRVTELRKVFRGEAREALDLVAAAIIKAPTAEIVSHNDKGWLIKAEVYGDGVDIWLRGQGNIIEVIDGGKKSGN